MIDHAFDVLYSGILRTLRRTLHECPESAGSEHITARVIASFLDGYRPDRLLTELGGLGVAAVYEGVAPGPTLMVRAELDALLSIEDMDDFAQPPHQEEFDINRAAKHRCGHDGHMTMVAALAPLLQIQRPEHGRVVLLFQPAEETGEGARRVLEDSRFQEIRPDLACALHNIPGIPAHTVVARRDHFSCASVGMQALFEGQASHAAEPEKARTPAPVLCQLLSQLPALSRQGDDFRLVTITHTRMGRPSFGITPGSAELLATLRAAGKSTLAALREEAELAVRETAARAGLTTLVTWHDEFPATTNASALVDVLERICEGEQIAFLEADAPFRWSEDFGHFADVCPILYFGLGVGEDWPTLHHPEYEFRDDVIVTGVQLWSRLLYELTRRTV